MLRSAFVLTMGLIGSAVGLTVAMAIPIGTVGCVIASAVFGVIWGLAAHCFIDDFFPNKRQIGKREAQRTLPPEPPVNFQKRLSAFANHAISNSSNANDDFRSSMPFWATSYPSTPTPAKSNRFIRLILLRIRQILRS